MKKDIITYKVPKILARQILDVSFNLKITDFHLSWLFFTLQRVLVITSDKNAHFQF